MRLLLRCGIVSDTGKELSIVHAAAADEAGGARWFGTSFDLKTAVAALGLAVTLIVQHVNTQTTITRLEVDLDAQKSAAVQTQRQTAQRIGTLETKVVDRHEIESGFAHVGDRLGLQQAEIQQLLTLQLARSSH